MDKKVIAIIIAVIVILLGLYQFVYVPYQNEEAIKNYNAGLMNVSAMENELNESFNKALDTNSSNVSNTLDLSTQALKESQPKVDQIIEKLNETRQYANGNETKEKYIDYQIQARQIEQSLISEMIQENTEISDALNKTDIVKMMDASSKIEKSVNSKSDEMKPVKENIINLLKDNPDFNQTLHSLNLTEDFYGDMNLTYINA